MASYVCTRPLTIGSDVEGASPRRFRPGEVLELSAAEAKKFQDFFKPAKVKSPQKKK
jgi:hypothetical protein